MRRISFLLVSALLAATILAAQDSNSTNSKQGAQETDETSRLTLKVLTSQSNQPVGDAHVVVRWLEPRKLRRDKATSWETKTNHDGVAILEGIPYGAIRVQVIAKGYQTYGNDHRLATPTEEVTVQLKPPQGQVSSY